MIARADDPGRKWLAAVTLVALSDQGEQSGPRVEQKPWILVDQKLNPQRIFHRLEVAAAYLKCVLASIGATKNLCDRGGHSSLDRRGGEGDSLQTSRRSRNEHPQRSPHS